jgi:hypothetical protein
MSDIQESINFAIAGGSLSLIGDYNPTFSRPSAIFMELEVGADTSFLPVRSGEPAVYDDGSVLIEPESKNFLPWNIGLERPNWYKGSNIIVRANLSNDSTSRREGDRIAALSPSYPPSTPEERAQQSIRQEIDLTAGGYTIYASLSLKNGMFGVADALRLVAGERVLGSVQLNELNDYLDKNRIVEFQAEVSEADSGLYLELYIENAVTLHWRGAQVENKPFRSSLIYQHVTPETRSPTVLRYNRNPISGLNTFGLFCHLKYWRGDGNIAKFGNLHAYIEGDYLKVKAGSLTIECPEILPKKDLRFFVQVSSEAQTIALYLNETLVAKGAIQGFRPSQDSVIFDSEGVRCLSSCFTTTRLMSDGQIAIGEVALEDVKNLFIPDIISFELMSVQSSMLLLNPITIPAAATDPDVDLLIPGYASVRLPFIASDAQPILDILPDDKVRISSTLSFEVGMAIVTSPSFSIEVEVVENDRLSNVLTLSSAAFLNVGDTIAQAKAQTEVEVDPQNYYVDLLASAPGVKIAQKYINGFILSNQNTEPKTVSPSIYIKH